MKSTYREESNLMRNIFLPKKSTHHLLFLGRSLVPTMAMAEIIDESWVSAIPFSRSPNIPTTAQELEDFYKHLDHYLQKIKNVPDKTILLVDYGHTGNSVEIFRKILEQYLVARNLPNKVEDMLLSSGYNISYRPNHMIQTIGMYNRLEDAWGQEMFNRYAPFKNYRYGIDNPLLLENEETRTIYSEFKNKMSEFMKEDRYLHYYYNSPSPPPPSTFSCDRYFF